MRRILRKWWGSDDGTTAVEFSLVGLPFVLMTVGIIELSVMFITQSMLQEAVFESSRLIRTGQAQQGGTSGQTMFEQKVCDVASGGDSMTIRLIPCNQIQYQVQQVPSFGDAEDMPPEFDEDGNMEDTGFDPGEENDIVLIRVAYNYPVRTPMMQTMLANNGSKRTLFSTTVIQTEPYQGF